MLNQVYSKHSMCLIHFRLEDNLTQKHFQLLHDLFLHRLGFFTALRAHRDIGLEFGFRARGPDHHRAVALQQVLEHI